MTPLPGKLLLEICRAVPKRLNFRGVTQMAAFGYLPDASANDNEMTELERYRGSELEKVFGDN